MSELKHNKKKTLRIAASALVLIGALGGGIYYLAGQGNDDPLLDIYREAHEALQAEIDQARAYLKDHPDDAAAYIKLAGLYIKAEQFDKARDVLEEALPRVKPALKVAVYRELARLESLLGNEERALKYGELVRLAESQAADSFNLRGSIYEHFGRWEKALNDYETAKKLEPGQTASYRNKARVYTRTNRFKEAERELEEAVKANPTDWLSRLKLARLLFEQGKPDASEKIADQLLAERPDDPAVNELKGDLAAMRSKRDEAEKFYLASLSAEGDNPHLHRKLAELYERGNQDSYALEAYSRALKHAVFDRRFFENTSSLASFKQAVEAAYKRLHHRLNQPQKSPEQNNETDAVTGNDTENSQNQTAMKTGLTVNGSQPAQTQPDTSAQKESVKELLAKAQQYIDEKNFSAAAEVLEKAAALSDDPAPVRIRLGQVYSRLARYEKAAAEYLAAAQTGSSHAWYYLGILQYQLKQYMAAAGSFEKARAGMSEVALLWYNSAITAEALKQYDTAAAMYEKAWQKDGKLWQAAFNRAIIAKRQKQYQPALSYMNKAREIAGNVKDIILQLGELKLQLARSQNSKALYKESAGHYAAVYSDFTGPKADIFNYALALAGSGQPELARLAFESLVNQYPGDETVYFEWARLKQNEGDDQSAINLLHKSLEINPDYGRALLDAGIVYQRLGDFTQALVYLEKAVKLYPSSFKSWYNLGRLYLDLEQYQQSIKSLDQALQLNPKYIPALEQAAFSRQKLGQFDLAVSLYKQILALKPGHATAHGFLGLLYYEKLNQNNLARQHLEKALKLKADHPNKAKIEQALSTIKGG